MIHKGLSGFGLHLQGGIVTKWTSGHESTPLLKYSCEKQLKEIEENKLGPIKTVDIYSTSEGFDNFEFSMPHMECPTGFTDFDNRLLIREQIRKSLYSRSNDIRSGFKKIIRRELDKIEESVIKLDCLRLLELCSDYYPYGYAHGDFGFANMLIEDGVIHMIDFTKAFINSPLLDIATLRLSTYCEDAKAWHLDLVDTVERDHWLYINQITIIKMIKVLSYKITDKEKFKMLMYVQTV